MDDNDDDKKRVLTPPADWSEGVKPKSSDDHEDDINESADWREDDDFEVPPASEMGSDSVTLLPMTGTMSKRMTMRIMPTTLLTLPRSQPITRPPLNLPAVVPKCLGLSP